MNGVICLLLCSFGVLVRKRYFEPTGNEVRLGVENSFLLLKKCESEVVKVCVLEDIIEVTRNDTERNFE